MIIHTSFQPLLASPLPIQIDHPHLGLRNGSARKWLHFCIRYPLCPLAEEDIVSLSLLFLSSSHVAVRPLRAHGRSLLPRPLGLEEIPARRVSSTLPCGFVAMIPIVG